MVVEGLASVERLKLQVGPSGRVSPEAERLIVILTNSLPQEVQGKRVLALHVGLLLQVVVDKMKEHCVAQQRSELHVKEHI